MKQPWWLALAWWTAACGGASAGLDLHFRASSEGWNGVAARVADAPAPATHDGLMFSITTDSPALLLAHDPRGTERWRSEVVADAGLFVAGTSVITIEDGSLVVRDATRGRSRFQRALEGMALLGAAEEGDTLVLVTAAPSITAVDPTSAVVALDRLTGSARWERRVTAALGAPMLRANVVLVPWNRQGLTAIDAATGRELARLEPERTSIDWIHQDATAISYGNDRMFDLACTQGTEACPPQTSPFLHAPSHPPLHPSAYRVHVPGGIATQLRMTRDDQGRLQLADDRAYLVFYRYVFAFRADGSLIWVQLLERDVVHTRAEAGGLVLVDVAGQLTFLRARDGHRAASVNVGRSVRTAQLSGAWASPASDATPSNAPSLHEGLRAVIVDHDNRLVVARGYAVEQLARDPDPVITKELLAAYEERATPNGLRQVIARALIERRTGSEHLIDALGRHHDFLTGVFPPPLPVVVPALLAMQERRAVPALLDHLQDPATSSEDIGRIADVLPALGDAALVSQLLPWLQRYRASHAFAGDPATITALAKAVRALGGEPSATALSTIADTGDTHPVLAAAIRDALITETPAETAVAEAPVIEAPTPLAKKLSQHDINAAFAPHTEALRLCTFNALADDPSLVQVRIAFVARADGSSHGFAFAPASAPLARCLKPIVDAIRLPAFDARPQLATYVVQLRHKAAEPTVAPAGAEAAAEWWSWYAREIPSDGAAWWSAYVEKELDWVPSPVADDAPARAVVRPVTPAPTPSATAVPSESPSITPPAPTPAAPDAWWLPAQP